MLFSALIITVMAIIFIIINHKNKFNYVFSAYFISLAMLITFAAMYVSKITVYPYVFVSDYKIFLFFSKIRIPFMNLYRLYIIAIAVFLMTPILFYRLLVDKYKKRTIVLSLLFLAVFVFVNDPEFSWNMHIYRYTLPDKMLPMVETLIKLRRNYNYFIMLFAMAFPIFLFLRYYFRSKIKINRRNALLFSICIFLIDVLLYKLFFNDIYNPLNFSNTSLTGFPAQEIMYKYSFLSFLLPLVVVFTVLALTIIYKPFDNYTGLNKKELKRGLKTLNNNLNSLLHRFKNAFIGINSLNDIALKALEEGDTVKAKETLGVLKRTSEVNLENVKKMLGVVRNINIDIKVFDIQECIYSAAQTANFDNISFKVVNNAVSTLVLGDEAVLKEAFVNIIQNAVTAINNKEGEGVLTVELSSESKFIIIDFIDNGIGINKKDINKIFDIFFTTKSQKSSSGIGLTYVERAVKLHKGSIEVISSEKTGTKFRIVIPLMLKI